MATNKAISLFDNEKKIKLYTMAKTNHMASAVKVYL